MADVNGGTMNGFIKQRDAARSTCNVPDDPACAVSGTPDVMGYHTAAEIPNYWTYAKDFALDDHMFEPVKSWSLPDHLYIVSAWSARCRNRSPMSCATNIVGPYGVSTFQKAVDRELPHRQGQHRPGLDRPHLAAVRAPRQLVLLRAVRRAAGLRERLGRDL